MGIRVGVSGKEKVFPAIQEPGKEGWKTNKTKTTGIFFGVFVFINGTAILVLF